MQAIYRHGTRTSVDHLNDTMNDIDPGQVVVVGVLVGVATHAIPAGELGALDTTGVFEVVKLAEDGIDPGETVYWDDNGSPVEGEATSGAAGSNPELGPVLGICVEVSAADDDPTVMVAINQDNQVPAD